MIVVYTFEEHFGQNWNIFSFAGYKPGFFFKTAVKTSFEKKKSILELVNRAFCGNLKLLFAHSLQNFAKILRQFEIICS